MEYSQATVFKGTYEHRIDPKGRLPLPAAFRRELGDAGRVVVTSLDQCLALYSPGEWAKLEAQLAALPAFSKPVKGLTRLLMSRAAECEIDVQGRILLPTLLRRAAQLERDALVVGVLSRIEVWSPALWADFVRESETLLDDVTLGVAWPLAPGQPAPAPPADPAASSTGPPAPPGGGHPQGKPNI